MPLKVVYGKGEIRMGFTDRTGEENYNTFRTLMKIIEYKDATNMVVEFQDEYKTKVHTRYGDFKKGRVKNPYDKTVHGVGYLGEGKYKSSENGKLTKVYIIWVSMIQRCYDPYYINKNLTEKISLDTLAEISNVSVNSLERHFFASLNMTPFTYIQKKRLAYSAKLLSAGKTVLEACYDSGFTDYPHYIALFKKYYGLTPLKYKKSILK